MIMLKSAFLILILALMAIASLAAPYQELIPKPGYVAVYIREGDTPLSEIHPKLAEAFNEDNLGVGRFQDKATKSANEAKAE